MSHTLFRKPARPVSPRLSDRAATVVFILFALTVLTALFAVALTF